MIRPEELRLNNLFASNEASPYQNGLYHKVANIGYAGVNEWKDMGASDIIPFDKMEGIPITEEILLKCGFEKLHDIFTIKIDRHNLGITTLGVFAFYNEGERQYLHFPFNVRHLHQLQNLFFSLTGQELPIQL